MRGSEGETDRLFGLDDAALTLLREARLGATLDRIFAAHPHYRRTFVAAGIRRSDIATLSDIARLPVTTKADYMADPQGFRLGPDGASDDDETVVWDVMYTTGSSGAPTPFVSTAYDFINILALNRNMLRLRGVTPDDSILNLFPLTRYPHGAFARVLHAAAACNIPVVSAMPGRENARRPELNNSLDDVVAIAVRARPTILWGVPSYIRRLIGRAAEIGVRLAFGASGLCHRRRLRRGGAHRPDRAAEIARRVCALGQRVLRRDRDAGRPGRMRPRLRLSQSGAGPVSVRGGRSGSPTRRCPTATKDFILLTHLDRRGTVMLRYALGRRGAADAPRCPHCGALTERIVSRRGASTISSKSRACWSTRRRWWTPSSAKRRCSTFRPSSTKRIRTIRCRWTGCGFASCPPPAPTPRSTPGLPRRVQRAIGVTPTWSGRRRTTRCSWAAAGRPSRSLDLRK